MEPLLQGFSRFIEQIDPYPFLCFGNEAIDKILEIPALEFSKISQDHIIALFNTLFLVEDELTATNPFFSCQLLTHIAKHNSELFSDAFLLRKLFSALSSSVDNHTSIGYAYQFFLALFSKKCSVLPEIFLEKPNIDSLFKNIACSSVCEMLKHFILYYPDSSDNLMCIILDKICMSNQESKENLTQILTGSIVASKILLITRVFTAERIAKIFDMVQRDPGQALLVICALLKLPTDSIPLHITNRILSETLPKFSEIFSTRKNYIKILMIEAVTLALNTNIDLIYPQIFQSQFVTVSTVFAI